MKIMSRILIVCLALAMLFGMVACTGNKQPTDPPAKDPSTEGTKAPEATQDPMQGHEKVKLTVWLQSIYSSDDMLKEEKDVYIFQCIERFNKKYPWIEIDVVKTQGSAETAAMWKAAALAGTAPDIAEFNSGNTMKALADYTYRISSLMSQEIKDNLVGWYAVTVDGETEPMGVPANFGTISGIFYNKSIIKECGLDFENNPPRSIEDFMAACEIIKNKGYTPIIQDEGKVNYLNAYLHQFWRSQAIGKETIAKLCNGEEKFSEHEGYRYLLEKYLELYTKGYVNSDCLTASDYQERFYAGEAAMNFSVSSFVARYSDGLGSDNLGFMLCPNLLPEDQTVEHYNMAQGGCGQGFIVSKDTKHPEEVALFLDHICSAEEYVEYYNAKQNSIPAVKEVDTSKMKQDYPVMAEMASYAGVCDGYFSYTFGDAGTAMGKYIDELFAGTKTIDEMLLALDEAAALYAESQKTAS